MYFNFKAPINRWYSRVRRRFIKYYKNYLIQSFLATVVVFIILVILTAEHAVIIASIGASAFIVFAMPGNLTANPRRIIGGHIVGLISGSIVTLIPHTAVPTSIIIYALAVGISMLSMVALDVEHPPASGTGLGVAISGYSTSVSIAVIVSSIMLSLAHYVLKRRLKDLV